MGKLGKLLKMVSLFALLLVDQMGKDICNLGTEFDRIRVVASNLAQ